LIVNTIEQIRAGLEADHPGWRIWVVIHAVGKRRTWCARREGEDVAALNAASPGELAEALHRLAP
jgi:hypothetical protein